MISVNSRQCRVRRELNFTTLDELITEAENLVASPNTTMLGKWTLGQLLAHLTLAINGSIDGVSAKAPWFIRLFGPILKRRVLKKMPAGFKLPRQVEESFFPQGVTATDGLQQLKSTIARLEVETMAAHHPVLGKLTHVEWTQLHLRHGELHLSFADPG